MGFPELVEHVGRGAEALGVLVMVLGTVAALVGLCLQGWHRSEDPVGVARRRIGQAILLGLEVLVAGDIIRTVAVKPSFTSVGVLAAIVAIRTFLSITLELEVSGRLPWHRSARSSPDQKTTVSN